MSALTAVHSNQIRQPADARRAMRTELRIPLAFRASPGDRWMSAWTVNVSRSGVLFELIGEPPPETIEFILLLAGGLEAVPCADVRCTGHIVRRETAATGLTRIATTIDSYALYDRPPHR